MEYSPFVPVWAPRGAFLLDHSSPKIKCKQRLARDVFATFVTLADVVHDVTDANCLAENISLSGRFVCFLFVFVCFCFVFDFQALIRTK